MKLLIEIDTDSGGRLIQLAKQLNVSYTLLEATEEEEDQMMLAYLKQAKDDELASKEEAEDFINSLG